MKKFTQMYLNYQVKFIESEQNFANNPNKKTATILSNLREKKFTQEEKYTTEHIKFIRIQEKEEMRRFGKRISNYSNSIKIESMDISEKTKCQFHKMNDLINPIK